MTSGDFKAQGRVVATDGLVDRIKAVERVVSDGEVQGRELRAFKGRGGTIRRQVAKGLHIGGTCAISFIPSSKRA